MTKSPKRKRVLDDQLPQDEQIEELQQQVGELTQALQRERADAINIRRQHDEQLNNVKKMVKTDVVQDLLPVIDNFERSLKHIPKELEDSNFIKGINAIVKQFEKTLEDFGVEKIKTIGEVSDPNLHEAVGVDGEDNEKGIEVVCEELQPGYKMDDYVIRHAMVKVKMENK